MGDKNDRTAILIAQATSILEKDDADLTEILLQDKETLFDLAVLIAEMASENLAIHTTSVVTQKELVGSASPTAMGKLTAARQQSCRADIAVCRIKEKIFH